MHIDVAICERENIGGQASGAAAGLLAPLGPLSGPGPFADLLLASFALFPEMIKELENCSGLQTGYEQVGALRTVRNPRRISNLQKRMVAWQPLGLDMSWLTGNEARQLEPLLAADICAAVYAPQEAQISAPQLVKSYAIAAKKLGAQIYEQTEIVEIQQNTHQVTGVCTAQGETFTCQHLIIATGAWSADCATGLQLPLPVRPLKGALIAFKQLSTPLQHIVFGEAAYLSPRTDRILVGATKEDTGFTAQVTEKERSWLYESAGRFIPALAEAPVEAAWAGLRPKTPDAHPILGSAPGWKNVTLAVGHNSVGVILSAITGQAIAQLIKTGVTANIIRPFGLERFQ